MPSYIDQVLRHAKQRVLENLQSEMEQLFARRAHEGLLHSGSTITAGKALAAKAVADFAHELNDRFSEFPVLHSPFDVEDFESAKREVSIFSTEAAFEAKQALGKLFGDKHASLIEGPIEGIEAAISDAQISLEGKRIAFASERSFWKWALGDLKKRVWSASLLAVGGAVTLGVQAFAKQFLS